MNASAINSSLNYYLMTDEEEEELLKNRQLTFDVRRDRVHETCSRLKPTAKAFNWTKNTLVYVEQANVVYCPIPKVASSTWTRNFMIIGGLKPMRVNHVAAPRLFPLPDVDVPAKIIAIEESFGLVIVRHPLSRLVSAYYSKMIDLGLKSWNKIRELIIDQYRDKTGSKHLWRVKHYTERKAKKKFTYVEDNPIYPR